MKKLKWSCCYLSGHAELFEPDWPIEFSTLLHSVQGTGAEKDVYLMTWQEKRFLLNTLRRFKEEDGQA